jgi:hypothetical protein
MFDCWRGNGINLSMLSKAPHEHSPRLKKAAHRVSAIRMRALNDPHQSSFPTVQTVTPLTRCACKPTIRHHPPTNSDSCSTGYLHLR